jgi:outer membrane protein with beta-barrel domain
LFFDRMIRRRLAWGLLVLCTAAPARAQGPPPRIGPFVVDLHATVPNFPDNPALAASRDLALAELPGRGLGLHVGAHVYPLHWKAVTFGLGGEFASSRARNTPPEPGAANLTQLRAVEEKLQSYGGTLSFNFGTGKGWSYISGGLGKSKWSVVPDDSQPFPTDSEALKTIHYGGGARWFMKDHLAFSVDVRFYAINPGSAYLDFPHPPRTTQLVIGAGISLK